MQLRTTFFIPTCIRGTKSYRSSLSLFVLIESSWNLMFRGLALFCQQPYNRTRTYATIRIYIAKYMYGLLVYFSVLHLGLGRNAERRTKRVLDLHMRKASSVDNTTLQHTGACLRSGINSYLGSIPKGADLSLEASTRHCFFLLLRVRTQTTYSRGTRAVISIARTSQSRSTLVR